jgi:hypothetical protein
VKSVSSDKLESEEEEDDAYSKIVYNYETSGEGQKKSEVGRT